jgi:trimeric autotransporter adhesin
MSIFLQTSPRVRLTPASVSFPLLRTLGTTSLIQTTKLTNVGSGDFDVTGVTATGSDRGDFFQANDCLPTVAAGTSCLIAVTFTPTAQGVRTASVSIADNAPGSPQSVPLASRGTFLEWAPQSLNMGIRRSAPRAPHAPSR